MNRIFEFKNYLVLFLSLALFQHIQAQSTKQPNIIFIISDDHSFPFLGAYGHPDLRTPNIDLLAKEGILFNKAYTTAPQCVLSRASLMTGRSVVDIRMTRFSAPLPTDIVSYPELLREAGYYTGLSGRGFHLDGSRTPPETERVFEEHNLRTFQKRVDFIKSGGDKQVLGIFNEFIQQVPKGKPFFLQVGYSDPHRIFNATAYEPDPANISVPEDMPNIPELRNDLAGYYGEIQRLDDHVGLLLQAIDDHGLRENTLVIFIGDNGGALLRGKGTLYDRGIHVPLLARWPGKIKPGSVSDALISGEDIAPTFLSAAGVQIPENVTGKSILPVFSDPNNSIREYVFAQRGAHGSGLPTNSSNFDLGRTVFSKNYKLIYNALWQLPYHPVDFANRPFWQKLTELQARGELDERFSKLFFSGHRPIFELFDLNKDPYEYENLIGQPQFAEEEKVLKAKLQEWMILNQDYLPLPVPPSAR
ncbi:sulfatase family protein [Sphingobacterium corticibacterium]|uniref:Arylsulfatase n=1 Tax=Sphingobacterium corticibacterium TaxID=2484746 RepID=A0A4Q6XM74_9SPHI|nr:sulfatase [Sphingobacterium corticibacterium]RZF58334.1 arylsulfatase [Sphingobacterium corticibacterium]